MRWSCVPLSSDEALCCLSLAQLQPVQCCSVLPSPPAAACDGLGLAKNALEVGHKKLRAGSKKYTLSGAGAGKLDPLLI